MAKGINQSPSVPSLLFKKEEVLTKLIFVETVLEGDLLARFFTSLTGATFAGRNCSPSKQSAGAAGLPFKSF